MSWFGKMIGGSLGLMMGGPLGAIAGAAIGHHLFDKHKGTGGSAYTGAHVYSQQQEQHQAAFFVSFFSLLGKLAKADGKVTQEEGEAIISFLDEMRVHGKLRQFAVNVFNEAKNTPHSVETLAHEFLKQTVNQREIRETLIDMLFRTAMADNEFHAAEEEIIQKVSHILGIPDATMEHIRSRYIAVSDRAYAALGVDKNASDDEIKAAYRKLVHDYHPDRITAAGLPKEFSEYATKRFQEIQKAWDTIKKKRNL